MGRASSFCTSSSHPKVWIQQKYVLGHAHQICSVFLGWRRIQAALHGRRSSTNSTCVQTFNHPSSQIGKMFSKALSLWDPSCCHCPWDWFSQPCNHRTNFPFFVQQDYFHHYLPQCNEGELSSVFCAHFKMHLATNNCPMHLQCFLPGHLNDYRASCGEP